MKNLFRILTIILTLGVMSVSLSACNTLEGIGKDASAAGDALTGAASENKTY